MTDRFLAFLNAHKHLVGLSDWDMSITDKSTNPERSDAEAELESNIYEKTVKVTMSPQFYTYNTKKQANILMHELVHSRITIFNKKVEMFKDEEEEHLANDLTRGFERSTSIDDSILKKPKENTGVSRTEIKFTRRKGEKNDK